MNRPAAADRCSSSTGSARSTSARRKRRYDRPVQEYVLSELDTGERLITERVSSFRSVSLGFWIGAGSRDEPDSKAGVSHFIEHLLFKGTRSYSALEIAEIFDELGGELNAATSRESTVVFARVPDRHLETALDVMADMVFSPTFADLETEREVVLEEIAMLEDTPQDLVHDLLSEAIFARRPARPATSSARADVISIVSKRALAHLPPADVHGREHRPRRAPATSTTTACSTCSSARRTSASSRPRRARACASRSSRRRRRACASSARTRSSTTSASAGSASRAPTGAASRPRCSTRSSAARPRRACSRRSARSAGWRTPSTASPRSTPTRG